MNPKDIASSMNLLFCIIVLIVLLIVIGPGPIFFAVFAVLAAQYALMHAVLWRRRMAHYTLTSDLKRSDWSAYPRPQLRRDSYLCLNDGWTLNESPINIPFAPQANLSGYTGRISFKLIYERELTIPSDFRKHDDDRLLLHFGAVDQTCQVYVDDRLVGSHEGGYLPFTIDVTECFPFHRLKVTATDKTSHRYPVGKQRIKRGGMWYTPVSGIWQTVWMEAVPSLSIESLKTTPDENNLVTIDVKTSRPVPSVGSSADKMGNAPSGSAGPISYLLRLSLDEGVYELCSDQPRFLLDMNAITAPVMWSPDNPRLYDFSVSILSGDVPVDSVDSYFALRHVEIRQVGAYKRLFLNGQPIFWHGLLDQGYFCDGIFLPANESGYASDILNMKELGFNLLRKHIKIEPEVFYYDCDRLGMMVMQDMVNSGRYEFFRETAFPTLGFLKRNDQTRIYGRKRKEFFEQHCKDTVYHLYNHPCIISYTVFNEGWGQYDSDRISAMLKEIDPTRIYDNTSGWFEQSENDLDSRHLYFDQTPIESKPGKLLFLSECGGFSQAIPGHFYAKSGSYGYGDCDSMDALTDRTVEMYEKLVIPSIATGLSGVIYTQVSDVEDEVNGIYTYDRKLCKFDKSRLQELSLRLYNEYNAACAAESEGL